MSLIFKLIGTTLGKPRAKKLGLKFLGGGTNIAGLAERVDANLSRGLLNNKLERLA